MKTISILAFSFVFMMVGFNGIKISSGEEDKITVGSSCKGIGSMEVRLACEGANILFCSSFTENKFKIQSTCPHQGQVCQLAADGKSATCVAQEKK